MAKNNKPDGKIIRVTMTRDYFIPMYDDVHTQLDGRTIEDIREEWFSCYPFNHSHASRDAHRLGNGEVVLKSEILTMKEAYP